MVGCGCTSGCCSYSTTMSTTTVYYGNCATNLPTYNGKVEKFLADLANLKLQAAIASRLHIYTLKIAAMTRGPGERFRGQPPEQERCRSPPQRPIAGDPCRPALGDAHLRGVGFRASVF